MIFLDPTIPKHKINWLISEPEVRENPDLTQNRIVLQPNNKAWTVEWIKLTGCFRKTRDKELKKLKLDET